jgi:hypothetical protein
MTSKAQTPGTYGKPQRWHVQMVSQAEARNAAAATAREATARTARNAALNGASAATLTMLIGAAAGASD